MTRSFSVLLVATTLGLASFGCSPGRVARRPAPPPKLGWVAHPAEEVKAARNAHDYKGAPLCQRCHVDASGKLLAEDPPQLCYGCHVAARMTHVNKIQRPPPATLPYAEGGRIVCHTCHDVHDVKARRYGFRGEYVNVCLECHKRH